LQENGVKIAFLNSRQAFVYFWSNGLKLDYNSEQSK